MGIEAAVCELYESIVVKKPAIPGHETVGCRPSSCSYQCSARTRTPGSAIFANHSARWSGMQNALSSVASSMSQ